MPLLVSIRYTCHLWTAFSADLREMAIASVVSDKFVYSFEPPPLEGEVGSAPKVINCTNLPLTTLGK